MRWKNFAIACVALAALGCGDDAVNGDPGGTDLVDAGTDSGPAPIVYEPVCEEPFDETVAGGRLWADPEDKGVSWYLQPFADEAPGLPDREVGLRLASGEVRGAVTCPDGTFRFAGLDDTVGLLEYPSDDCTTANCPTRFAEVAGTREVKVVTFGDSIPHFGPEPWFPQRFADLAEPVADVENVNVAVPGATSVEWLPGGRFFTNRIEAHLDADVWVFTLGGNDLQAFADDLMGATEEELQAALGELQPLIDEIVANIEVIVAQIRELSPDSDIIWVVYPNYGSTEFFKAAAGPDFESLVENVIGNILAQVRRRLAGFAGMHVVDILGATKDLDVDALLIDPLHLNEEGHAFYARELFMTLGGVVVSQDEPLGLDRTIGYAD